MSTIDSKTHRTPVGTDKIATDPDGFITLDDLAAFIGGGGGVLAFTADSPPSGTVAVAYSYTFTASGSPPATFAVTSGALPVGLALNGTTGVLSGTPTNAASYNFEITVSNGINPNVASGTLTVTIAATGAPPITPTLAWYDPSDLASLTVATGLCSQMNDKTVNANHQTASGAERPTSGVDTINSLNVLKFDGSATLMLNTPQSYIEPVTMFAVLKLDAVAAVQRLPLIFQFSNTGAFFQKDDETWAAGNGAFIDTGIAVDTNAHVLAATFNGTSSQFYLDDANVGNGGSVFGFVSISTSIAVGAVWLGDVGEVLIYDSILSGPNIAATDAYLKAKWNTP